MPGYISIAGHAGGSDTKWHLIPLMPLSKGTKRILEKEKCFIAAEATMKTKAFIVFMLGVVKK